MTSTRPAACPVCQQSITDGDRFCKQCGTDVSGASSAGATASSLETAPSESDSSPWDVVVARLRAVTLGDFDIGRELGRGGMAAVFLAHDLALNRKTAIKVMAPGLMLGDGMVQRFRQEAITIANLSHPHIVSVYAVRQLEDLHFFVMQFIDGQSLETVLRTHQRLPVDVVRAILFQVGSALAYAHRRGVIHRDVKPGNILLTGDGDAMVTDFGIAKVAEGPTQTQTGMVVGTPSYMSPEQCYALDLDGASDQYSLGIVAYQMLTGHVPFSGPAFAIMRGHTTEAVPPIRELIPDLPAEVDDAILRMLAKSPRDRFATFGEALEAMGAQAISHHHPLRERLIELAAVEERRAQLGSLLHTPTSPIPPSRGRQAAQSNASSAGSSAPMVATPPPVTPPPVAAPVTPMEAVAVTAIAIAPVTAQLEPGDSITLTAAVRGAKSATALQWRSETPELVRVEPQSGVLTVLASGRARIVAFAGATEEQLELVIAPASVASIEFTGAAESMRVGESLHFSARALDKRSQTLDRAIMWSADGAAVVVEPNGVVHARVAGRSTITIAAEHATAQRVVEVLPLMAVEEAATPSPVIAKNNSPKAPPLPSLANEAADLPDELPSATHVLDVTRRPARSAPPVAAVPTPATVSPDVRRSAGGARWLLALLPIAAIAWWFLLRGGAAEPLTEPLGSQPDTVAPALQVTGAVTPPDTFGNASVESDSVTAREGAAMIAAGPETRLNLTTPPSTTLKVAEQLALRARLVEPANGRTVSGPLTFSSSNGNVARVNTRTGVVSALSPGRATIRVDAGAAGSESVNIIVTAADAVATASGSGSSAQGSSPPTSAAGAPESASTQPPSASGTPPGGSPSPAANEASATATVSQAQLASEARTTVESFAAAIRSRDLARVRAVYPGISSVYAGDLKSLFDASKEVAVTVNAVRLASGEYNASLGARTQVTASVTFRLIPQRGAAPPPSNDVWPVTLLREANGWRLVQVGAP